MKSFAIAAVMAATASLAGAQASQVVVHQTLTSVVVVDLFPAVSTSTAYMTSLVTILGCPPWEEHCPVRHNSVAVVTLNTAVSTTVCPLTLTSSRVSSYATTVISTSAPSSLPDISTTTTTWPSNGARPSSYSPYSIPSSVWDSQSDISLGEPSGPLAGTKGDPAPTSLGSDFFDPPAASVDSSALSDLSSAVAGGSSAGVEVSATGASSRSPASVGSTPPTPIGTAPSTPSGSASPAASGSVSSDPTGNVSSDPTSSASPAPTGSAALASSTGSSSGATSVFTSAGSASSTSINTSGLLRPATDSYGNTLSTLVSAHTAITTISGPSGVTVSISTGSVTILVGVNTTSVIQNFLPVTYSSNQSTATFPIVTYMPTATGNSTANGTLATSTPLWTNSGTAAPVNMFSICLAIVALVLVL